MNNLKIDQETLFKRKTMIGHRIKDLRRMYKITQRELGEVVGMTRFSLCRIERGRAAMHMSHLIRTAQFFELPLSFFFMSDEELQNAKSIEQKIKSL